MAVRRGRPFVEVGCSNYLYCIPMLDAQYLSSGTQLAHMAGKRNWWGRRFAESGRTADCIVVVAAVGAGIARGCTPREVAAGTDVDSQTR